MLFVLSASRPGARFESCHPAVCLGPWPCLQRFESEDALHARWLVEYQAGRAQRTEEFYARFAAEPVD